MTLLLLASEPTRADRLRERLEQVGLRPHVSALHRLLTQLEKHGDVSAVGGDGQRTWRLTPLGRERLEAKARKLAELADVLQFFSSEYESLAQRPAVAAASNGGSGRRSATTEGAARDHQPPVTPVEDLPFSSGCSERLRRAGIETIEQLAELTIGELSRRGLRVGDVRQIVAILAGSDLARRHLPPPQGSGSDPDLSDRDVAIVAARARGETFAEIAGEFGLSRERVRQIVAQTAAGDAEKARRLRTQRKLADVSARREEILSAFRTGSAPDVIAIRLGLSRSAVGSLIASEASPQDRAARHAGQAAAAPRAIPEDRLVEALRKAARDLGHVPQTKEYREIARVEQLPSVATLENRFGGWNAAVAAAGLAPANAGRPHYPRRWTEDACLAAVRRLEGELGYFPTVREYDDLSKGREDLPSWPTVRNRLGSWSKLVLRLADETNGK